MFNVWGVRFCSGRGLFNRLVGGALIGQDGFRSILMEHKHVSQVHSHHSSLVSMLSELRARVQISRKAQQQLRRDCRSAEQRRIRTVLWMVLQIVFVRKLCSKNGAWSFWVASESLWCYSRTIFGFLRPVRGNSSGWHLSGCPC